MKKNLIKGIFLLIAVSLLPSCSDDGQDLNLSEAIQLDKTKTLKGKIGDIITIKGKNLDKVNTLYFHHADEKLDRYNHTIGSIEFVSKGENEIQVVIPNLRHEDVFIRTLEGETINLKIHGLIPTAYKLGRIRYVKIFDDKTAVVSTDTKIFKSTDGYFNWELLYEIHDGLTISSTFFLDESNCWIGVQGRLSALYYSSNGGRDFDKQFTTSSTTFSKIIRNIQFTSITQGFFSNYDNEVFKVDGNSFTNIYEYFPDLNNDLDGKIEFFQFNSPKENLLFLSPNNQTKLVRIENDQVSYNGFNTYPGRPQMFSNIGYLLVNGEIFKTNDTGISWSKLETTPFDNPTLYFLDENYGYAFLRYPEYEMYRTTDGAKTWQSIFKLPSQHAMGVADFTKTNSLFSSAQGIIWKFVDY